MVVGYPSLCGVGSPDQRVPTNEGRIPMISETRAGFYKVASNASQLSGSIGHAVLLVGLHRRCPSANCLRPHSFSRCCSSLVGFATVRSLIPCGSSCVVRSCQVTCCASRQHNLGPIEGAAILIRSLFRYRGENTRLCNKIVNRDFG